MPYLTCPECRFSVWEPTAPVDEHLCPRCLARRSAHSPMATTAGPPRRFLPSTVDPRRAPRMGAVMQAMRRARGAIGSTR